MGQDWSKWTEPSPDQTVGLSRHSTGSVETELLIRVQLGVETSDKPVLQDAELLSKMKSLESAYASLVQDHAELKDEHSAYKEHVNKSISKLKDDKEQLARSKKQLLQQFASLIDRHVKSEGLVYPPTKSDHPGITLNNLASDAKRAVRQQVQIQALQQHVKELQEQLLARVDKVQVISDDQFSQEFMSLASSVRTMCRGIKGPEDASTCCNLKELMLFDGVDLHCFNIRPNRKHLVEACIWSILVEQVFSTPFIALGDVNDDVNDLWTGFFGSNHLDNEDWPKPARRCENWRLETAQLFIDLAEPKTKLHGDVKARSEVVNARIQESENLTFARIEALPPNMTKETGDQACQIIEKAFALAMKMASQRCRLHLTIPKVGAIFKADSMRTLPEDDSDDMLEGKVTFVVTPGLTKWGNADGDNLTHRYDIVPALVKLDKTQDLIPIDRSDHKKVRVALPKIDHTVTHKGDGESLL